ncbi:glycoside hydrolase family 2 protein [Bacteroides muris (ex Fokt et al. 2023)]|uniref:Beta-galactosidase n=1 Tax=Bacteroides muris (ex Fokt et al. 2023) TaxID=2937417 RepID=A0A9X2ST88_9BACE|nr:glycoside hydrolase family 2 TIM barrel-domain containing protein [Bacteroides muris (ex Fokt et al. 2023)]MCR6504452.1 beta-galactosidase [Bacteroides muris (ex Fokt et al. 2023)]
MKKCLSIVYIFIFLVGSFCKMSARKVTLFNDGWEFKKGPFSKEAMQAAVKWNAGWQEVTLPHTWNADDMQKKVSAFYEGVGYYRKKCIFPESMKGKRLFLRFEGVGSCAEVYVNGYLTGTHKGAYSAFVCEIGSQVKFGEENEIIVKADNTARPDVIPVNHVLFGVYGGIYRPVWLVITEPCGIVVNDCASSGVYITQKNVSKQSAEVNVKVKVDNATLAPVPLVLENVIYDGSGKLVKKHNQAFELTPQGVQSYSSQFKLSNPHLWQGREDPYLYKVVSRLLQNGRVLDEVVQPLGLRKYEVVAGKGFFLNGKKYPMYGVTRHQDWWGLGSALTNKEHDFDLAQIMDIGATTVRFAHYQQSDYIYSRCDTLGLVIWAEIPFVNRVTGQEWDNAHQQMRELVRQSFNHPSIYVWGIHNEVYHPHGYTTALTQSVHDLCKLEDPDRYTVSVNGYGNVGHPVNQNADIQGMNRYFGWYERKIQDIKPWIEKMEKEYPWQRLMLTEYGADANIAHQTEILGDALNWTSPFYPETFQTKTHEYQWSIIAKHPYITASYLWNMFDFAVPTSKRGSVDARNMKGMMTFDRKIKKDSYFWYKANWSKEPVLYMTQRRNVLRERKETSVTVYSNIGTPKVYLNDRELSGIRKGYTDVHYVFDKVLLNDGKNVLRAVVTWQGREYVDEMEWEYRGECNREADFFEHKKEHGSW